MSVVGARLYHDNNRYVIITKIYGPEGGNLPKPEKIKNDVLFAVKDADKEIEGEIELKNLAQHVTGYIADVYYNSEGVAVSCEITTADGLFYQTTVMMDLENEDD